MLQRLRAHAHTMEAFKTREGVDTTVTNPIIAVEEDAVRNTTEISAEAMLIVATLILHINVGHMECVPIQENIAGPHHTDTRRTQCGATRC